MIGLPGETDADVLGIAETLRWLQRECTAKDRKRLGFTVTISNFTPKPHTPFQWHSVSTSEFERKQELLRQEFRTIRGIKANFTDVRISAMEDFVGRGDRRLAAVVRRAWELGAGMDAWWESLDRAFAAWTQAITESELTWKYRQIENGEWNLFHNENPTNAALSAQNSQSITQGLLDAPLPWDHIDTGIDKRWLQADLQRALEAATVPDCSFDGCSHCGVCGADFGHNIVVPAPAIPEFTGHFVPNQNRVQRLRVWFGKQGDMALISHLDLMRLFDRAVRRAAIPVTFTGGFHPGPRIVPASALPLGTTSSGEIVDFDLTGFVSIEEFSQKLAAQLPETIPIYRVEAISVASPSATQLLERAEYVLTVQCLGSSGAESAMNSFSLATWQTWIDQILAEPQILIEQTTKSGKVQQINLRERLFELQLLSLEQMPQVPNFISSSAEAPWVGLRYVGSCRNDGTLLRPEHVIQMLELTAQQEFQLAHIHRQQLFLAASL
jgi:radical SAM-linked protein